MSDEPVNRAIDEAARRMTDGSPADGFRRRVLARIEANDTPRRSWRAGFVLSPIAVAAVIVTAVMFMSRPGPLGPGSPAGPKATALQTPPIVAADPTKTAGPAAPPDTAGPQGPALPLTVGRPGPCGPGKTAGPEGPALQIELDPNDLASIAVAPLAVDTMTPDSIQIPRLDAITPIAVAPLEITDPQRRFE